MTRLFGIAVVVIAMLTAAAAAATATHQNANSDVALWITDADGSNEKLLVDDWPGLSPEVEWAPDGSMLAVLQRDWVEGQQISELVLIDPNTGLRRPLTERDEVVSSFVWSPDGDYLLYSFQGQGERGFRTVEPDGTNKQTVYTPPRETSAGGVDFSPDGGSVSFFQGGVYRYLHILDLGTGTARLVTRNEDAAGSATADWSPNGEWIGYDQDDYRGLYLVRPDGTGGKTVAPDVAPDDDLEWAPDSSEILFTGLSDAGWGTYLVAAESGAVELRVPGAGEATWSHDGQRFAYSAIVTPAEDRDVYSAARDGSDVMQLTSEDLHGDYVPNWSPDGSRIVFVRVGAVITCPQFYNPATIIGTTGDDRIEGTPGQDFIAGRGGNDEIVGLGGDDIICGGKGDDLLLGGDGNDELIGDAGRDVLSGEVGNDVLDGRDGDDSLDGGEGRDAVSFASLSYGDGTGVTVDLAAGQARGFGNDVFVNVEDAYGSRHADLILGTGGRNRLFGGPFGGGDGAEDVIKGRGGRDVLEGWTDSDELFGGRGPDRLDGDGPDRYHPGKDRLTGGRGRDTCMRGERYVSCEIQRAQR